MASLALGVAGAVVGAYFGNPQLGFLVGSYLGGFLEEGPHTEGPRLNDRNVQASTYGIPIPIIYGTDRVAGNIIWSRPLREVPVDTGGKGGPSASATTYSYYGTFAVSLCNNEITTIRKIWADGRLIYDASDGNSGPLGISLSQAILEHVNVDDVAVPMLVYPGTETQLPDPTIESYEGAGNVPAFRGQAYAVFTDFPLERFGNRIPNLNFEVVCVGTIADQVTSYTPTTNLRSNAVYIPITNEYWMVMTQSSSADPYIARLDADTGAIKGYVYGSHYPMVHWSFPFTDPTGDPVFDPLTYQVYFANSDGWYVRIDAASGVELAAYDLSGSWPILGGMAGPYYEPAFGNVWFVSTGVHEAIRINKFTGSITDSPGFSPYLFGGGPTGLTQKAVFDDFYGRGYLLLTSGIDASIAKQLWVIDEFATAITSAYTHTADLELLAYDSLRHYVLITTGTTLIRFDVNTKTVHDTFTLAHNPAGINYDAQRDLYVFTNWALGTGRTWALYASSGAAYKDIASTNFGLVPATGRNAILMSGGATSQLTDWSMVKIRFDVVTASNAILSDIVADICERAGLASGDIDVSELTDEVLGYVVTRQEPARANVQQLATGFLFDGVESDDVVKFRKRGRASAVTIPADDLAAHQYGAEAGDIITKTRAQDVELPQKLNVIYSAIAIDYAQQTQLSERLATPAPQSAQIQSVEVPIVFTDDYAKALADALMFNAWTERTRFEFATGIKYSAYEPTDVVTVVDKILRITRKHEADGIIKFEGVADDSAVYTQDGIGVSTLFTQQAIAALPWSFFTPLDSVLLRDAENNAGFYAAVGGYASGWPGAVIYKSSDSGTTYSQLLAFSTESVRGVVTNALGNFYGGNIFDELNTITVALWGTGSLSSATRDGVLAGANAAAIASGSDWEIVQFRTATLNANGTYTLSGLLRGRRGSEFAMAGHAIGDAFVLLEASALGSIGLTTAEIGAARDYKAVTLGASVADALAIEFTCNAVRLMPLAPVHLGGGRDASSNFTLNWRRRSRIGQGWANGADVPLGEDSEAYEVVIYSDGTYTTIKRTITGLSTQTASYSAANQTTDFGSTQSTIYGKVYQVSATVGRGHAATFAL